MMVLDSHCFKNPSVSGLLLRNVQQASSLRVLHMPDEKNEAQARDRACVPVLTTWLQVSPVSHGKVLCGDKLKSF